MISVPCQLFQKDYDEIDIHWVNQVLSLSQLAFKARTYPSDVMCDVLASNCFASINQFVPFFLSVSQRSGVSNEY